MDVIERQRVLDCLNEMEVIESQGGEEAYALVENNEENRELLEEAGIPLKTALKYGDNETETFCIIALACNEGYANWYTGEKLVYENEWLPTSKGMDFYKPRGYNAHTLLYTFQYENAIAQIITTIGGNCSGGSVMDTDLDCGITVPSEHELTKKHVVFYDNEDEGKPFREVGDIIFYYPNGDTLTMELDDCSDYLIGIKITNCEQE